MSQLDYMLGLSDLTGELMRFCIKSESIGDYDVCSKICEVLQVIQGSFISLGYIQSKDLYHKLSTLHSSVKKVEDVCYSHKLRKSEIPDDIALKVQLEMNRLSFGEE